MQSCNITKWLGEIFTQTRQAHEEAYIQQEATGKDKKNNICNGNRPQQLHIVNTRARPTNIWHDHKSKQKMEEEEAKKVHAAKTLLLLTIANST